MKPSDPGLLFVGSFFVLFKLHIVFHFYWLVCSNHLFLGSVLVGCMFLESCPFLLGCQICWHIIVHTIPMWFFCISVVSVLMSPFSFLILFICILSSSWWAWPEVCQSCLFFQRTSFWFYWLFLFFFLSSVLLLFMFKKPFHFSDPSLLSQSLKIYLEKVIFMHINLFFINL